LTLNFILIPLWGLPGAAVATLVGNIVFRCLQTIEVWVIFQVHAFSIQWFKVVTAAALAVLVALAVRWVHPPADLIGFLVATVAFLGIYLLVNIALGLAQEDRDVIARVRSRGLH
jgi:O-antigen/teichoic acid export membrane protein